MGYTLPATNISLLQSGEIKHTGSYLFYFLHFFPSIQESKGYVLLIVFTISYLTSQPDFLLDQEYRLLDMLVPIYPGLGYIGFLSFTVWRTKSSHY